MGPPSIASKMTLPRPEQGMVYRAFARNKRTPGDDTTRDMIGRSFEASRLSAFLTCASECGLLYRPR